MHGRSGGSSEAVSVKDPRTFEGCLSDWASTADTKPLRRSELGPLLPHNSRCQEPLQGLGKLQPKDRNLQRFPPLALGSLPSGSAETCRGDFPCTQKG